MLGSKLWTIRQKQEQRSKQIASGIFKIFKANKFESKNKKRK